MSKPMIGRIVRRLRMDQGFTNTSEIAPYRS
jgi:hypothetical protein